MSEPTVLQRVKMPETRPSVTCKNAVGSHEFYVIVGFYDEGSKAGLPGEVFITISKEGSILGGMCDALSKSISIALQYGVPWDVIAKQLYDMRFDPWGPSLDRTKEYPSIAHAIADTVDGIIRHRESLWKGDK